MRFVEILSHLTGLRSPVFGVSWNPPEPHVGSRGASPDQGVHCEVE